MTSTHKNNREIESISLHISTYFLTFLTNQIPVSFLFSRIIINRSLKEQTQEFNVKALYQYIGNTIPFNWTEGAISIGPIKNNHSDI